jgi:hypothetical protein
MSFLKIVATAMAVTLGAVSFASTAQADRPNRPAAARHYDGPNRVAGYKGRYYYRPPVYRGRHYYRPGYRGPYYYGGRYYHDYNDYAVAAGIFGFAAGAVVGAAAAPRYYGPRYYGAPYYGRTPARYYGGVPAPWTPAWYAYCEAKYRSFNPRTGMFLGYDGQYHLCR